MPTFGSIGPEPSEKIAPPIHWLEARRGSAFGLRGDFVQHLPHRTVTNPLAPRIRDRRIVITKTLGPGLQGGSYQFGATGISELVQESKTSAQNLGRIFWIPSVTITVAAEQFAKSFGIYGALVLAKDIVRQTMSSSMLALHVDRIDDPDEDDLSTICFTITSRESVDKTLECDNRLRETLSSKIPPSAILHLSFAYDFE